MNLYPKRVGILTAGGLAPCLASAVGSLIERYSECLPECEIRCYKNGYQGLLMGDSFDVTPAIRATAASWHSFGGSPLGNSRVKLSNVADCLKRGLIKEGEHPEAVAAKRLQEDQIDVLHTIGGDDTNTAAAGLAAFLEKNGYSLTVLGLPKTVDNDVYPIHQSLGAWTAAEHGARFFENVVAEQSANPKMLIVHEVMGRNCGWLTAHTAAVYLKRLQTRPFIADTPLGPQQYGVHGLYVPEMPFDLEAEGGRLRAVMEKVGCVNLFVSEGAGVEAIIAQKEAAGETLPRDAFGHVKLDAVNAGQWFAAQLSPRIGAQKVLVQKSGYFARSAPANAQDLRLIQAAVDLAVEAAQRRQSGVIGHHEAHRNRLEVIPFAEIRGGKPLNTSSAWVLELLQQTGQLDPKAALHTLDASCMF